MRRRLKFRVASLALIAVIGFSLTWLVVNGSARKKAVRQVDELRLGKTTDVDIAAWLKLSRPELAKLTDEWAATLKIDQDAARNSPNATQLLPRLHPPVRLPAFRQAVFSPEAGISLPPYVLPGSYDSAVALHLARFGDHDAARKLADPANLALQKQIDAVRYQNDYPVEWSRLVGLVLASSQFRLAGGDVDSATRLVLVHRQLRDILDGRAAQGPLGSILLSTGRRALVLAAKAWRESGQKCNLLAEDVETAVSDWGKLPTPSANLLPGATKEQIASVFGRPVSGKVVNVLKPEEMIRPLDLMDLPIPTDALAVVSAFLDTDDRLAEIQLTYRAKIDDVYPEAANLAFHLEEAGVSPEASSLEASLYSQTYKGAGLSFEAARTNRSNALGGWVRVSAAKAPAKCPLSHSPRIFGPVDLDRGFEANRRAMDSRRDGASYLVTDKAALNRLCSDLHLPAPISAELLREKDYNILAGLTVAWSPDQATKALEGLLPGLWSAFGNSRVAAVEGSSGAYLGFTWQDEHTRLQLRFPFDDTAPILVIRDSRGTERLPERAVAVHKRDEAERKMRLDSGKAEVRLSRSLGVVNDYSLEALHLGQNKIEAETLLPSGPSCRRRDFPGGVSLVILSEPLKGAPFWARHILLRYVNDEVAEIRVRYQEGLAAAKKGETLLERLSDRKFGAPESIQPSWTGLWTGQSRSGSLMEWRWEDDLTFRTYQRDAGGSEVVLTDRAAADAGKPLGPLEFIPAGVPGCRLGDSRESVRAALKGPAATSGGADIHRQPADSPYEMLLVWYVEGKVSRITAVDRLRPTNQDPAIAAALSQAWGRDVAGLGFIRRQEGEHGRIRSSYFWNDDRTRVEIFVQDDDQGIRLMTEWRSWSTTSPKAIVEAKKKPGGPTS